MAIGGGDVASPSAAILTVALLFIPPLLACRPWLPTQIKKYSHLAPLFLISATIIFRIRAMWNADGRDAQVVGWLPQGIDGMAALPHIFDGPAGLMLGLLFGFSIGLALNKSTLNQNRLHRWAAICWVVLLGWGTPSDGFAQSTLPATLSTLGAEHGWENIVIPLLGLGLSFIVLPTLCQLEIQGPENVTSVQFTAAICLCLLLLDLSHELALTAVIILIIGAIGHLRVSLWVHDLRGQAIHYRWAGLLVVFFYSAVFIIFGMAWLALSEPWISDIETAIWSSRLTVGWILLCGLVGALTPTIGWDARPRPEAWGFLVGLLISASIFPRLELIEYALFPIFILCLTIPIMASLVEYRMEHSPSQRMLELTLILCVQFGGLVLLSVYDFPLSLICLFALTPVLWIHHKSNPPSLEEEE